MFNVVLNKFINLFYDYGDNNKDCNSKVISAKDPSGIFLFDKVFQDNQFIESRISRKIIEVLSSNKLIKGLFGENKITFSKERLEGIITCKIQSISYDGIRTKDVFKMYLNHQSNSTLQIKDLLFSSYLRNMKLEIEIYRYISMVAMESGYAYLEMPSIVYESKDEFNFSEPDIGDYFPLLEMMRNMDSNSFEETIKNGVDNNIKKLLELVHGDEYCYLPDVITHKKPVAIKDVIITTNPKLTEVQKNYLIKMARKLFCILHNYQESGTAFKGQCGLLSQIVSFIAIDKLNIPQTDILILHGHMEGMGAHTVTVISGRQVDATADQFEPCGKRLNLYEDNSLYFRYSESSPTEYQPATIVKYMELFRELYEEIALEEFLCVEDRELYMKSKEAIIFY